MKVVLRPLVRVIADHRVILVEVRSKTSARRSTVVEHTMDVSSWLRKQLEETSPDLLRVMVKAAQSNAGELGLKHRRGGYRDPESQAFIERVVRETQRTGGVAERVRDPRRRPPRDRRLRRPLPPPAALTARPQDALRGQGDLGRSTKHRGLNCQLRRGARQVFAGSRWVSCRG